MTRPPGDTYRRIAHRYFRASLFCLVLGTFLGVGMMHFGNDNFRFLHSHVLLVGTGLFAAYGAGFRWIAGRADAEPVQGVTPALASVQFWAAGIGLPGMLLGSVLPVGLGLDRIGVLFGLMEAVAAVLFALLAGRALRKH